MASSVGVATIGHDILSTVYTVTEIDENQNVMGETKILDHLGSRTVGGVELHVFMTNDGEMVPIEQDDLETVFLMALEESTKPSSQDEEDTYIDGSDGEIDSSMEFTISPEDAEAPHVTDEDNPQDYEELQSADLAALRETLFPAVPTLEGIVKSTEIPDANTGPIDTEMLVTRDEIPADPSPMKDKIDRQSEIVDQEARDKLEVIKLEVTTLNQTLDQVREQFYRLENRISLGEDLSTISENIRPDTSAAVDDLITTFADSVNARSIAISRAFQKMLGKMVEIHQRQDQPIYVNGRRIDPSNYMEWDTALTIDIFARVCSSYDNTWYKMKKILSNEDETQANMQKITREFREALNQKEDAENKLRQAQERITKILHSKANAIQVNDPELLTKYEELVIREANLTKTLTQYTPAGETFVLYCVETKSYIRSDRATQTVSFTNTMVGENAVTVFQSFEAVKQVMPFVAQWAAKEFAATQGIAPKEKGIVTFTIIPMKVMHRSMKPYQITQRNGRVTMVALDEVISIAKPTAPPAKKVIDIDLDANTHKVGFDDITEVAEEIAREEERDFDDIGEDTPETAKPKLTFEDGDFDNIETPSPTPTRSVRRLIGNKTRPTVNSRNTRARKNDHSAFVKPKKTRKRR